MNLKKTKDRNKFVSNISFVDVSVLLCCCVLNFFLNFVSPLSGAINQGDRNRNLEIKIVLSHFRNLSPVRFFRLILALDQAGNITPIWGEAWVWLKHSREVFFRYSDTNPFQIRLGPTPSQKLAVVPLAERRFLSSELYARESASHCQTLLWRTLCSYCPERGETKTPHLCFHYNFFN